MNTKKEQKQKLMEAIQAAINNVQGDYKAKINKSPAFINSRSPKI
jgi:hypothetical protein